uniref:Uncharacterized protein n=1 Tax=Anguilla anguilla TaxID=7936 RepID=A0A0E9P5V6_ANGAN
MPRDGGGGHAVQVCYVYTVVRKSDTVSNVTFGSPGISPLDQECSALALEASLIASTT